MVSFDQPPKPYSSQLYNFDIAVSEQEREKREDWKENQKDNVSDPDRIVSAEETERLKKSYPTTFVKLGQRFLRMLPGKCVLPVAYGEYKDRFKNWNIRPDDVYVFSFPKTGTTWTQELVWCVQNDCNIKKASSIESIKRVPFLDLTPLRKHMEDHAPQFFTEEDPIRVIENMPSPRILKSHLPFYLFPDDLLDKSKVVLCLRNPKDTVVSYFHHETLINLHGYEGDFAKYFDLFMDDLLLWCPYFDYVAEAWKRRHHPNLCILFYEVMKIDLASNIKKVAKFLGEELTEEQVGSLVDHLSFNKMKENKSVNMEEWQDGKILKKEGRFFRKGQVGDWKNYFTNEMNTRMDEAIENHLKPIGLEFRYE